MRTRDHSELLFVYGTLHPDRAPTEIADVVTSMKPMGRATIRGVRYDLEFFPALIIDKKAGEVEGELYALPGDPEIFRRLDEYEEYYPQNLPASLFRRERTTVTLHDGSRKRTWIYVYNQPLSRVLKSSQEAIAS